MSVRTEFSPRPNTKINAINGKHLDFYTAMKGEKGKCGKRDEE
jgi:hypothetical protein